MDFARVSKNSKILVSVFVSTYNHEQFIAKSLEGILMQQTSFRFEIVIGEDASTDSTRKICEDFASQHPDKIRLLPFTENLGVKWNFKRTLNECHGKYTALCEGDDYWTEPLKLEKQVQYLESNPEYVLCSTRYTILNTADGKLEQDKLDNYFTDNADGIDIASKNFFEGWLTKTVTVVFKTSAFSTNLIDRYRFFRDIHLFYHVLKSGKGYLMNFVSSQYNLHENGVWSPKSANAKLAIAEELIRELKRYNPEDPILKENHVSHLLMSINARLGGFRQFYQLGLYRDIIRYAMIKKAPGFMILKLRQMIRV